MKSERWNAGGRARTTPRTRLPVEAVPHRYWRTLPTTPVPPRRATGNVDGDSSLSLHFLYFFIFITLIGSTKISIIVSATVMMTIGRIFFFFSLIQGHR